jgi:hypothetical protein
MERINEIRIEILTASISSAFSLFTLILSVILSALFIFLASALFLALYLNWLITSIKEYKILKLKEKVKDE